MENETELIRQQMLETRTSLSEKLEALQEQVLSTVEGTTRTVTETVQTVQEAVQDTVSTVSGSVQDTVDSVKDTLDLKLQVTRRPWLMVGGAVAVGFVGGRLLNRVAPLAPAARSYANGYATPLAASVTPPAHAASPAPVLPAWLEAAAGPVMKQVQEMALGALTGLASDMVMKHAPEHLHGQLREMTNNVASALGTKPIHGLLSDEPPTGRSI